MPRGYTSRFTSRIGSHFRSTIRDVGGRGSRSDFKSAEQESLTFDDVKTECLEAGCLWEDPDFPACDSSMFYSKPPTYYPDIEWLRPKDICDDPQMFVGGASRLDVNQGVLGDCWFLAAVSCIATNEDILYKVVPQDQSFDDGDYAGVFKFVFWQYGRYVEVLVDDRLPTHNGKLIYMHSDDTNEFWTALIEKAYAKLNGSYESLSGGHTSEALTDFTGGVVQVFPLREETPEDLFTCLLKAFQKKSMMGCSIAASPDEMEAKLDNGLIIGHAYSITDVRYVDVETERVSGRIPMLRIRNPWGDSHEWQGAWGDNSEEWTLIAEDEREEMGLNFEHDGEFWMSYEDFTKEFQKLEICHLGPTLIDDECDPTTRFKSTVCDGSWKRRVNAGGCRNYPASFWTNPQFRITIEDGDPNDDDGNASLIVAVMQKDRRKLKREGGDNRTIGYAIYGLDCADSGNLDKRYFDCHKSAAMSPSFTNQREVTGHHSLAPGEYVILPSTFEPNCEAEFVLRIFGEQEGTSASEIEDETGQTEAGDTSPDESAELEEDNEEQTEEASEAFLNLAGVDKEIDAFELKTILDGVFQREFEFDGFSTDMCKGLVANCDEDLSGRLDYGDFKKLWSELALCKKVFKYLDEDKSGYFNSCELRKALSVLGLKISNTTFSAVAMRFSDQEGHIRFDDFSACVIKLRLMFDLYNKNMDGDTSSFGMDEFVQMTMYS